MLDAFIIEQIRRRERKDDRVQPRLENPGRFPLQPMPEPERKEPVRRGSYDSEDDDSGGIAYIDM